LVPHTAVHKRASIIAIDPFEDYWCKYPMVSNQDPGKKPAVRLARGISVSTDYNDTAVLEFSGRLSGCLGRV